MYRNEEYTGRYNLLIEWDGISGLGSVDSNSFEKPLVSKGGVAKRTHRSFWFDVASISGRLE